MCVFVCLCLHIENIAYDMVLKIYTKYMCVCECECVTVCVCLCACAYIFLHMHTYIYVEIRRRKDEEKLERKDSNKLSP